MVQRYDLIISDDTNLKTKYRTPLLELAMAHGYFVEYHTMQTPIVECVRRDALPGACVRR